MGQRLNVEIISGSKPICATYFHWSGYTSSSIEIAKDVINAFKDIEQVTIPEVYKRMKEACKGSSVTFEEANNIKSSLGIELAPEKFVNRNDGLIYFSEKEIKCVRDWEEARVTINLDNKTCTVDAAYFYTKEKDIKEIKEDYSDNIVKADSCPLGEEIPFDDFEKVMQPIFDFIDNEKYTLELPDGTIVSFIE
jgi:hypothetical protein